MRPGRERLEAAACALQPRTVWERVRVGGGSRATLVAGLPRHLRAELDAVLDALEQEYDKVVEELRQMLRRARILDYRFLTTAAGMALWTAMAAGIPEAWSSPPRVGGAGAAGAGVGAGEAGEEDDNPLGQNQHPHPLMTTLIGLSGKVIEEWRVQGLLEVDGEDGGAQPAAAPGEQRGQAVAGPGGSTHLQQVSALLCSLLAVPMGPQGSVDATQEPAAQAAGPSGSGQAVHHSSGTTSSSSNSSNSSRDSGRDVALPPAFTLAFCYAIYHLKFSSPAQRGRLRMLFRDER